MNKRNMLIVLGIIVCVFFVGMVAFMGGCSGSVVEEAGVSPDTTSTTVADGGEGGGSATTSTTSTTTTTGAGGGGGDEGGGGVAEDAAPVFDVAPTRLEFSATVGGANPATQNIVVRNTGGGTIHWTVTDGDPWLTIDHEEGDLGAGAQQALVVSVNIAGLAAVNYDGLFEFSAGPGVTVDHGDVDVTLSVAAPQVQAPTLSPDPGLRTANSITVTIDLPAEAPAGAQIIYTTDGTAPNPDAAPVAAPVEEAFNRTTTVRAIAVAPDYDPSEEQRGVYTLKLASPILVPAADTYTATSLDVTMGLPAGAPDRAGISYTVDGTVPDEVADRDFDDLPWDFTIHQTRNMRAIAVGDGYEPSDMTSRDYILKVATPTILPVDQAQVAWPVRVTIALPPDAPVGAQLLFTDNGADPSLSGVPIGSPYETDIEEETRFRVIARCNNFLDSEPVDKHYYLDLGILE